MHHTRFRQIVTRRYSTFHIYTRTPDVYCKAHVRKQCPPGAPTPGCGTLQRSGHALSGGCVHIARARCSGRSVTTSGVVGGTRVPSADPTNSCGGPSSDGGPTVAPPATEYADTSPTPRGAVYRPTRFGAPTRRNGAGLHTDGNGSSSPPTLPNSRPGCATWAPRVLVCARGGGLFEIPMVPLCV